MSRVSYVNPTRNYIDLVFVVTVIRFSAPNFKILLTLNFNACRNDLSEDFYQCSIFVSGLPVVPVPQIRLLSVLLSSSKL